MTQATYSGKLDFGDWVPNVQSAQDMADEIEATFLENEDFRMYFSDDALSVEIEMQALGGVNPPKFSCSLEKMTKWIIYWHNDDPDYSKIAAPLVAELRRLANKIEAETTQKEPTA